MTSDLLKKDSSAFTLIEMAVVVAVIAILSVSLMRSGGARNVRESAVSAVAVMKAEEVNVARRLFQTTVPGASSSWSGASSSSARLGLLVSENLLTDSADEYADLGDGWGIVLSSDIHDKAGLRHDGKSVNY